MHQVIGAIIYAKDEEEALDTADSIFNNMAEQGTVDYYTIFNEDGNGISGKSRWGNIPACMEAGSKDGKNFIDSSMKYAKDDFMENIKKVRCAIDLFTDEELFDPDCPPEKPDKSLFRLQCHHIGKYEGSSVWLYDHEGNGIRTPAELKWALSKYANLYENEKNPYKNDKIWVVPADMHY